MSDEATRRARRRYLTDGEIELWLQVTRTTRPFPGSQFPIAAVAKPAALPLPPAPVLRRAPSLPAYVPPVSRPRETTAPPALMPLERRLKKNLARGRVSIEAAIDLHGMQQAQAHQALIGFVLGAQRRGEKLVLIVTGKGKRGIIDRDGLERVPGVLRRNVPHWLRAPELRHAIVGFEAAAHQHGGEGALYVRLRSSGRPLEHER